VILAVCPITTLCVAGVTVPPESGVTVTKKLAGGGGGGGGA